jgi:TRAP-type mannitol/chloroaromatic compound transport system permease small subunit
MVWEHVLIQQWSYTNFHREQNRIKISGKCHPKLISQVCREARWVMVRKATKVEGLGWFDFEWHLFFFRDIFSVTTTWQLICNAYS